MFLMIILVVTSYGRVSVIRAVVLAPDPHVLIDSGLLDRFAKHDAVLFELFGQYGVEEGVAAGVQRQHEYRKNFGLLETYQFHSKGCGQGEESYGRPAQEIGEHQQGHPLGYPRVVRVPDLGSPDGAVHLEVASHKDEESNPVDDHEKHHVGQGQGSGRLEGQTDGELAVVRDTDQRQSCHSQGEEPTHGHDACCVTQGQTLVQVHRVGYRVIALQGYHREGVDAEFGAQDTKETSQLAAKRHLPGNGVLTELALGGCVHHC